MQRHKLLKITVLYTLIVVYTIGVCMLGSCTDKSDAHSPNNSMDDVVPCSVGRLDLAVYNYSSLDSAQRASVADSFSAPLKVVLGMYGYPVVNDSILQLYSLSAAVKIFTPDAKREFMVASSTIDTLAHTAARVDKLTGRDKATALYTIVTPFNQSVITADSIVLIGLNHYLGVDYEGYEGVVPTYMLPMKTKAFMPYALAEGMLAATYPFNPDRTSDLLTRMLYEGAMLYAVTEAVPDGDVASALAWNPDRMDWAEDHEQEVWNTIIGRDLIFSLSEADASRLLSPSPKANIISGEAPGQIGRYIGYKIVLSYLDRHPGTPVSYLLSPAFYSAENTLEEAAYHPR